MENCFLSLAFSSQLLAPVRVTGIFNSLVWVEGWGEVEELRVGRFLASGQGTQDPLHPPVSYPNPFLCPLTMQGQICWRFWAFHLKQQSNCAITFIGMNYVLNMSSAGLFSALVYSRTSKFSCSFCLSLIYSLQYDFSLCCELGDHAEVVDLC